jgi:hypothetical protein
MLSSSQLIEIRIQWIQLMALVGLTQQVQVLYGIVHSV